MAGVCVLLCYADSGDSRVEVELVVEVVGQAVALGE